MLKRMLLQALIALLCLVLVAVESFVISPTNTAKTPPLLDITPSLLFATDASSSDADNDDEPLQLPATGESSFGSIPTVGVAAPASAVVGPKFELQYTCNLCETRNSNQVSRIAYRTGVVICVCKGCMTKHWIADNLGWSDHVGGFEGDTTNIEEYFAADSSCDQQVNRVSPHVFELEKVLHDSKSDGAILDNVGNTHME